MADAAPVATLAKPSSSDLSSAGDSMIDPALADMPVPAHHHAGLAAATGSSSTLSPVAAAAAREPGAVTSITDGIANAPVPHTIEFSPLPFTTDDSIDLDALQQAAEEAPGSPTARLMRAIAPPNAAQPNPNWSTPPPNASVNLFIGRALLSNGNDNWPLKPNDIVTWIRKHYPQEWDGDEGRCSAHRVRTYLARKGADMYYEKLNQGCIAGWRIRQNHLWRFENGGFQGRGMKQEEAIAAQQRENEMAVTAAHKAAAAAALAAGHPSVKTSVSTTGDFPSAKRARRTGIPGATALQQSGPRRKRSDMEAAGSAGAGVAAGASGVHNGHMQDYTAYDPNAYHGDYGLDTGAAAALHIDPSLSAGPSTGGSGSGGVGVGVAQHASSTALQDAKDASGDPAAGGADGAKPAIDHGLHGADGLGGGIDSLDPDMVHQAMQAVELANAAAAAASLDPGQMDDLDMGMQLPIEMQMHGAGHDDDEAARNNFFGTANGQFGAEYGYAYPPAGQ